MGENEVMGKRRNGKKKKGMGNTTKAFLSVLFFSFCF